MGSRLYFNGDSFVAGVELGDDIIPGYPGLSMSIEDRRAIINSKWYRLSHTEELPTRGALHSEISKLERERCFAATAANKLNIPFINSAIGGSSNDRILRTSIIDLLRLKKEFPDDRIYAFIGTTNIHRNEVPFIPNDEITDYWYDMAPKVKYNQPSDTLPLMEYYALNQTEYHSLINFYKNISFLREFCSTHSIQLYFIAAVDNYSDLNTDDHAWMDRKYLEMPDLKLWSEYAGISYTIDMTQLYKKFKTANIPVVCPGTHYGKPVHDEVADMIIGIVGN